MRGNPINYDKKYNKNSSIFGKAKLDSDLRKYLNLLNGKNVLDLGIGGGQNSILLSDLGYNVTGIDYSVKALDTCKSRCSKIHLVQSDIREYNIEPNKYDLIMSRCVLHYLHKDDINLIIQNIKSSLKPGGIVYLVLFSTNDDDFNIKYNSANFTNLPNNIFHHEISDTYFSYFTKSEVLQIFSDFKTLLISDEYSLDLFHDKPHYHGIIKYIGTK